MRYEPPLDQGGIEIYERKKSYFRKDIPLHLRVSPHDSAKIQALNQLLLRLDGGTKSLSVSELLRRALDMAVRHAANLQNVDLVCDLETGAIDIRPKDVEAHVAK